MNFARKQEPQKTYINLKDIVESTIELVKHEMKVSGIKLIKQIDNTSYVFVDSHQIQQVLINIINNAIQAMENGGTLTLKIIETKDHYEVLIEDTGQGIQEKNIKKIYDPFFSTKDKGSGLGLSIVRNIIEGHKGHLSIESRHIESGAQKSGTRVIIRLPKE